MHSAKEDADCMAKRLLPPKFRAGLLPASQRVSFERGKAAIVTMDMCSWCSEKSGMDLIGSSSSA